MREALAWRLFAAAGVPASRHTYAKLAINATLPWACSRVIEQVDKRFLKDHFGDNDEGNLYKAACGDAGLRDARASGRRRRRRQRPPVLAADRRRPDLPALTNEDDPAANSYDDLAALSGRRRDRAARRRRPLRHRRVPRVGGEASSTPAPSCAGPGVNMLLGSWDNYFATPVELLPLQLRTAGDERDAVAPYFTFIPWDYDNSFGIDYFGTRVAVHRHRRLARQHRALPRPQPRPAPALPDPAGAEPAAPTGLPALLPRPPGAPARHRLHPGTRRPARSADGGGLWDRVPRPPTWSPTRPTGRRSPAASSPTTRCSWSTASSSSCGGGRRASRRSPTMCACAMTGPANSWPCCAGFTRAGPAAPPSRCRSRRVGGERTHACPPRPGRRSGGRRGAPRSQRRVGARRLVAGRLRQHGLGVHPGPRLVSRAHIGRSAARWTGAATRTSPPTPRPGGCSCWSKRCRTPCVPRHASCNQGETR